MPWPHDRHFVGRTAELAQLRAALATGGAQAIHGIGGVGKTQLAVEYAERHATDYELVWWVPAGNPADIVWSLSTLAARLDVAVPGEVQLSAERAAEILQRGELCADWLIIADNAGPVSQLVGAENPVTSCDLQVFVDEAAESISPQRPDGRSGTSWSAVRGWALIE